MTELERKLAETLRAQAGEVTPNLDAAWVEQQRRQRRPRHRRSTVVIAPLAAALVLLTSVLLATLLNTAKAPTVTPAEELVLAKPEHLPMAELLLMSSPVALTEFAGQSDRWRGWAFSAERRREPGRPLFCVAALPADQPFDGAAAQSGMSPQCVPFAPADGKAVLAGYAGEPVGPLPPGKAVYLLSAPANQLRLYDAHGDLSQGQWVGRLANSYQVFLAGVTPGSPPVRADVS
ncbi:hypothetical protein [Amycolatopsis vancoresmycina]|uniref:Uncharacterized protein n=1 Tax=Amycolatopsis vancoresmycina DSM 44592 TaxID=1292037 RepID=R1IAU6_9PSEU|nr:hypothetical protein [Amycolatopsis vancoresmycina]EOD69656.1 hypothetical protein H480_05095 [Amycolatopsis vancoresmycina DSM 44592]